ncbi:MalY/PatB family protein [Jiulongibacter sediminis]|jgi:cystathionine beta-lyase|uniref:MalY/PatB family protein n=1 Tax=Jiulongibacter sediminis TaxID=1605367 RepID=UPI0026EF414B|nr:PatB family C-S lyase [Jiulongibacter sediminis]
MPYNFDKPTQRRGSGSVKWDMKPENILPMWVADMDFESPDEIKNALQDLVDHQIYGYAWPPDELFEIIIDRLSKRHQWQIKKEWIVLLPGLVPGLHASARILEDKPAVMTSTPVYFHLFKAAGSAGNETIEVPFDLSNGGCKMDFESMQKQITPQTGMYMLCNPQNPIGRVFDKEELLELSDFCLKNDLILVSDEIHCDLILDESKEHISVASLNKEIENQSITLLAPSKTWNIAGLGGSFAVIPNPEIREKFEKACFGIMPHMNNWQIRSVMAAYKYGEPWRKELIKYLKANHDYLLKEVNNIPGLSMEPCEATYLAWIACDKENPEEYLLKYGLGVSGAHQFKGKGYFRLNFGTQRANLEKAIGILKKAFS